MSRLLKRDRGGVRVEWEGIGLDCILTTFVLISTEINVPTSVRPSTVIMQTLSGLDDRVVSFCDVVFVRRSSDFVMPKDQLLLLLLLRLVPKESFEVGSGRGRPTVKIRIYQAR